MYRYIAILFIAALLDVCKADAQTDSSLQLDVSIPEVLRQGDHFEFIATVINHSNRELTGQMQLLLTDAATYESVDGWFQNVFPNQFFTIGPGATEHYKFPVEIPFQFTSLMQWRLVAVAGGMTLEKKASVPVLSNQFFRMEKTNFRIAKKQTAIHSRSVSVSDNINNLLHKDLSLSIYSSRLWEAPEKVANMISIQNQPLDYFERWAGFCYAKFLYDSFPAFRSLLEQPAKTRTDGNTAGIITELTPWAFTGSNFKNAPAFSMMLDEEFLQLSLEKTLQHLLVNQDKDGSFPWFAGGDGSLEATRYIIRRLDDMIKARVVPVAQIELIAAARSKAIKWNRATKQTPLQHVFTNPGHDSLFRLITTYPKQVKPLPPIKWISKNFSTSLTDSLHAGIVSHHIPAAFIKPALARSEIIMPDTMRYNYSGTLVHSYFTDLPAAKKNLHLRLSKKFYVQKKNGNKINFIAANENTVFQSGDRIRIELSIQADHPLYYLVVSDLNPSAFRQKLPGMFVKRNQYNYYERPVPLGRKYFFPVMPAGKHVFTYYTTATQAGKFSAGLTTAENAGKQSVFNFIKGFPVNVE